MRNANFHALSLLKEEQMWCLFWVFISYIFLCFQVPGRQLSQKIPFDYVLMDEASQALLPMIAAAFKLGKQEVVWIGDQKQLSPIVAINDDIISDKDWSQIINGFDTLCNTQKLDSYLLSDTFRLMPRAADSTGVFLQ